MAGGDPEQAGDRLALERALDGRPDEAMALFREAFAAGARHPDILTKLIPPLNRAGRPELALEAVEMWVNSGTQDPGLFLLQARQLSRMGRFAEALDALNRVLAASPRLQGQEELHADLLSNLGRYMEAADVLWHLLRRSFERPEIHSFLSTLLRLAYDDRGVLDLLEAAAARDPSDAAAWYHLCEAQRRLGHWRAAATSAETCARLAPSSTLAASAVARCAVLLNDYAKASPIYEAIWDAAGKSVARAGDKHVTRERPNLPIDAVLYLPVEIVGRDFFTRLLVAHHALSKGLIAVVLPHTAIKEHAAELPPGIILHKSLNAFDLEFFENARSAGHIVTTIDEEAFGWIGDIRSVMRGTDPRCYAPCEAVFAPGENYLRQILQKYPDAKDRFILSGNPRTDILGPSFRGLHAAEAAAVREHHGPHLLVATNFGLWNSAYDAYSSVCKLALTAPGPALDQQDRQWLLDCYKSAHICEMESMAALTTALGPLAAAFPDRKVVVRPHPVENAATWEQIASKMKNVVVDSSRSFPGHALAADVVIHLDGCGTGLEALLLGRPTVCLAPVDGLLDPSLALASRLSQRARDTAALIALVSQSLALGERPPTTEQESLVAQHLTRPAEGVAAAVADHLANLYRARGERQPPGRERSILPALRTALDAVARKMKPLELRHAHTFQVKRIRVDEHHVRATLSALAACLGSKDEAYIERASNGCFIISRK